MTAMRVGWAQVNGVSLRYALHGSQGSQGSHGDLLPVVVLLHEMGGCLESWDAVVEQIAPLAIWLRFDMRGAGLSEKRHEPFTLDDLVEDLSALLGALGFAERVILAGCAVGAAVALRFAALHPERVAGVMAMSPATGLSESKKPETLELADFLAQHGLRARLTQRFDRSYPERYFEDPAARQAVWGRLLSYDPVCYAETYRMLCGMDLAADLAAITCPTLMLGGHADATRPPALVAEVAGRIRGARYLTVDSGHVMPVLTPRLVARHLMDFVTSLVPVAGPARAT